jgi:CheY-like chemotaxis protein
VLVVEDCPDTRQSLAMLLRLWGFEPLVAADGPAALDAARSRPDVVLLDLGLPKMDGNEVARRLRAQPEMSEALLVAISGFGTEDDRRRSREAGCSAHLLKPVEPEALHRLLVCWAGEPAP